MKLAFESYPGPDSSPVLLLLHGFLSSRAQWIPNIKSLCEFCRPVTAELWGHGSSPVPGEAKYYKAAGYSEAFETLRKEIGVGSWFVCGQSFSAGLIANYSLQHPEVVRGQILTNSLSAFSPPTRYGSDEDREAQAKAVEAEGLHAIEKFRFHPRYAKRFPAEIKQAMLADAARLSPKGIANAIRYTRPELSVLGRFERTLVPTLIVNGLRENGFQPLLEGIKPLLQSLKVVDLDGGHSINIEAASSFNEVVKSFMTAGSGSAG